jgi:hypothetical protein
VNTMDVDTPQSRPRHRRGLETCVWRSMVRCRVPRSMSVCATRHGPDLVRIRRSRRTEGLVDGMARSAEAANHLVEVSPRAAWSGR